MKTLKTAMMAAVVGLVVAQMAAPVGAEPISGGVNAVEIMTKSRSEAPDLSGLVHQQVQLLRPPFVHAHDQVAKGGPKVVQFTLPVVKRKSPSTGRARRSMR